MGWEVTQLSEVLNSYNGKLNYLHSAGRGGGGWGGVCVLSQCLLFKKKEEQNRVYELIGN